MGDPLMKKLPWALVIPGACLSLSAEASAVPLFLGESFRYTPGTSPTANGWTNHSGTKDLIPVTTPGLFCSGYASSGIGNAASLTQATAVDVSIYDVTGHLVKKIAAGALPLIAPLRFGFCS
jgi:hypothetical protein